MGKEISFNVTNKEELTILKIVKRMEKLRPEFFQEKNNTKLDFEMDITAAHCNGCKLRLEDLLASDDREFLHDIYGISRHISRKTGKLLNCFRPKFAKKEK